MATSWTDETNTTAIWADAGEGIDYVITGDSEQVITSDGDVVIESDDVNYTSWTDEPNP